MLHIVVASKNPVKLKAVEKGFCKVFPNQKLKIEGASVVSGVSNQPLTDEETYTGACNRVRNAQAKISLADYWVGLEGGVDIVKDRLQSFAWIVVANKNKRGASRTASFTLPENVSELINQGLELGSAMDQLYNEHNSKQKQGAIGILSNGLITRTGLYTPAVVLALTEILSR